MELLYSKKGIPYIRVDDTDLIFSSIGMKNDRYKYIILSKKRTTTLNISGAKAKKKKEVKISEQINGCYNMNLRKPTAPNDVKKVISPVTAEFLRKTIGKYLINGYFPKDKISDLKKDLEIMNGDDPTDVWEDDPSIDEEDDY